MHSQEEEWASNFFIMVIAWGVWLGVLLVVFVSVQLCSVCVLKSSHGSSCFANKQTVAVTDSSAIAEYQQPRELTDSIESPFVGERVYIVLA